MSGKTPCVSGGMEAAPQRLVSRIPPSRLFFMLKNRTYPMRQPAGSYQQMPRSGQATSGLNRPTQNTGHLPRFIDF